MTKWAELHDVITVTAEGKSTFMAQINNLEANLHSKTEEATDAEKKRAKMEEMFIVVMEQNHEHARTNTDINWIYDIVKAENEQLHSKIERLQAKLKDQHDSFLLEKTSVIY